MKLSHVLMRSAKQPPPDFLELVSTAVGTATNSRANFNIPLPALEPNDLVVVSLAFSSNIAAPTINSSGWTQTGLTTGVVLRGELLTKVVDGSESDISCTSSKHYRAWVVRVYRSKTGRIPKISATSQGTASGASWDLPAITPDGGVHGTQKFTFITAIGLWGTLFTPPAEYSNFAIKEYNYAGIAWISAVIAQHESEAASDDPGMFTAAPGTWIQFAIWEE